MIHLCERGFNSRLIKGKADLRFVLHIVVSQSTNICRSISNVKVPLTQLQSKKTQQGWPFKIFDRHQLNQVLLLQMTKVRKNLFFYYKLLLKLFIFFLLTTASSPVKSRRFKIQAVKWWTYRRS